MNSGLCYYDNSVWVSPTFPYITMPLTLHLLLLVPAPTAQHCRMSGRAEFQPHSLCSKIRRPLLLMLKNQVCSLMLHVATACEEVALGDPICYGSDGSILTSSSEEKRDEMVDKGVGLIWNDFKFCWLKPSTVDWCLQERIVGIYYNLNTCERGSVEWWREAVLAISRIEWRGRLVLLHQHIYITVVTQLSAPACGVPVW